MKNNSTLTKKGKQHPFIKLSKVGLTLVGVYLLVVLLCLRYYLYCKGYYAEIAMPYLFCDFPLILAEPLFFGFRAIYNGLPNDVSSFWQLYLAFLLLHILLIYYIGFKLESLGRRHSR